MEDDLCIQLRPKAEEMCWFKVTNYNDDLSLMLTTKFHDLSSKTTFQNWFVDKGADVFPLPDVFDRLQ